MNTQHCKKSIFSEIRQKTFENTELDVINSLSIDQFVNKKKEKPMKTNENLQLKAKENKKNKDIFQVSNKILEEIPIINEINTKTHIKERRNEKNGKIEKNVKNTEKITKIDDNFEGIVDDIDEKPNESIEIITKIVEKPEKPSNLFKVFENKENSCKLPQKPDISYNMESRMFGMNRDYQQEIDELKVLAEKYENKIDSLIAENLRMSNKLQEYKQNNNKSNISSNIPNIEAKLDSLLKENQKLTEIIKSQASKMSENEDILKKIEKFDEEMKEKEKKIEGLKKEIFRTNLEKNSLLEELMEVKLSQKGEFEEKLVDNEKMIRDLRNELAASKEENMKLSEKIKGISSIMPTIIKKNHDIFSDIKKIDKKEDISKNRKKIDTLHETFDTLAILNEKLNVHLDALQAKNGKGISERMMDKMNKEQIFQNTLQSEDINEDF